MSFIITIGCTVIIDTTDITETTRGYRVDKKIAGRARLRKTFASYDEAEHVLSRYVRGDDIGEYASTTRGASVTWADLYENAHRRRWKYARSTTAQDNARRAIDNYLGWHTDVRSFGQKQADRLADALEKDCRSLSTVSRYTSAVRTMLNLGVDHALITWALPRLVHHADKRNRINYFDYEQEARIENVLRQSGRDEHAELFVVLIESGMRTAEGMYLKWRDVDFGDGLIRLWGADTKTGEDRRIPITGRCMSALCALYADVEHAPNDRVFPNVTKGNMRSAWEAVRKAEGNTSKDFVWYTTRHTCATRLMRAGVDVKTVQMWLGHARIETTMRYIQFSRGSLDNAATALDSARSTQ